MIALVAHGSAWLANQTTDPPRLESGNSTFQYVRAAHFGLDRRLRRVVEADDVATWLRQLADRGVDRLWLSIAPERGTGPVDEHMVVAFVGGGLWSILASARDRQELWHGSWSLADRDSPDRRIWTVAYRGVPASSVPVERPALLPTTDALLEALGEANKFAVDHELDTWTEWFRGRLSNGGESANKSSSNPG